jgi:hypothetical protein
LARVNARSTYRLSLNVISWLLIGALLALTVLPMHVHLQHVGDTDSFFHEHVADLHLVVENIDSPDHGGEAVFSATPDGLLKKLGDTSLLTAILVCLGILLLSRVPAVTPGPVSSPLPPMSGRFTLAPPLRAPPAD